MSIILSFYFASFFFREFYCIDSFEDPNNDGSQYNILISYNPFIYSSVLQFLFNYQNVTYNKKICTTCVFDGDEDIVKPEFYNEIEKASNNDNLSLAAFVNLIVTFLNVNYTG